jgi:Fur family zinc uptake transcriptional regulator
MQTKEAAVQPSSFSLATTGLLDQAGIICDRRGSRLTELRRQVLGLVLDSETPIGAYDLLDRLRSAHKGAAPPTVYRALDFLLAQGLVHKVERLSAFVGCVHPAGAEEADRHGDGQAHHHAAQFLICTRCNRTVELENDDVAAALSTAAKLAGFMPHRSTVEVEGLCAACANG